MTTKHTKADVQAWSAYRRAALAVAQAMEQDLLRECDMPLAWCEALAYVSASEGQQARMQELADAVGLSPSGLTRMVDRMEAEKLLRRTSFKNDRRGVNVALAPAGRKALAKATPVYQRGVQVHFAAKLAQRDVEALAKASAKLSK